MSFFAEQTKTFALDDKNTFTARRISYGERQRLSDQWGGTLNRNTGEMRVRSAMLTMETLKASIVAWDGPGFEGRECTPDAIEELPATVADDMIEHINGWDTPLDESEKNS